MSDYWNLESSVSTNNSANLCDLEIKENYLLGYHFGYWIGMSACSSFLTNGITIILWISWMSFILFIVRYFSNIEAREKIRKKEVNLGEIINNTSDMPENMESPDIKPSETSVLIQSSESRDDHPSRRLYGSSFLMKCCCLLPLECCMYFGIVLFATLTVVIPYYSGNEFRAGKHHGNWCYIVHFGWQVSAMYAWVWSTEILLVVYVFVFSICMCLIGSFKEKKRAILKLFCYALVIWIFMIPATIHRVYVGSNKEHKDIPILAFLQETFMSLIGTGNILIFFFFLILKLIENIPTKREHSILLKEQEFEEKKRTSLLN